MMSLILPTYNGASTLPRMLGALRCVTPPPDGLEIIAVNNASTDETPQILAKYANALPMSILHEPRRGKSFALNHGIDATRGELLVFTDDDVIPEPDWLLAFSEAARLHPDTGLFAGQVRHSWETTPPDWLRYLADLGKVYGGTPVDQKAGPVKPRAIKGANFLVRRSAMHSLRFREDSGRNYDGVSPGGGEDTDFATRVISQSGLPRFVPQARVQHIVRKHQIGIKPVFKRSLRLGIAEAVNRGNRQGHVQPYSIGAEMKDAFRTAIRIQIHLVRKRPYDAARCMVTLAWSLGRLVGYVCYRRKHVTKYSPG